MDSLVEIARLYGPVIAVIAFYIWRDWRRENQQGVREEKLVVRLNKLEDYQRNKLEGLVVANTETQRALTQALNLRPCINGKVPGN